METWRRLRASNLGLLIFVALVILAVHALTNGQSGR